MFCYCCDGKPFKCKWHDNSIVGIASKFLAHEPLHQGHRRVRNASNVSVTQSHLIYSYNIRKSFLSYFNFMSYDPV